MAEEGDATGGRREVRTRESSPPRSQGVSRAEPEGGLRLVAGARACEAELLERVAAHVAGVRDEPTLLAAPLRIVVPSGSLREHLSARVVQHVGAAAGVGVQTLYRLAHEILARAGVPAPGGGGARLLPVWVRRAAAEEPSLREALHALHDGYGVAVGAVSDLLDAGFEPALAPALLDGLAEAGDDPAAERARALVRAAAAVQRALAAQGHAAPAELFVRARDALEARPEVLPAAGVLVTGYADATGVQADLLDALIRVCGATVWVDLPPDPLDAGRPAPGASFADRLRGRLGARGERRAGRSAPPSPPPRLVRAPGAHAEVRAVAAALFDRVHRRGVAPERLGVVVRDLAAYRVPLRVQLGRLAIPFSGGRGALAPEGRRVQALLELLDRGPHCPADRWLDAVHRFGALRMADLRLALHGMGVGRLDDVADRLEALLGEDASYALPVRRGLLLAGGAGEEQGAEEDVGEVEGEGHAEGGRAKRRTVSRTTLQWAWETAGRVRTRLGELEGCRTLGDGLATLRGLLGRELGWRPDTPGATDVWSALAGLEAELGPELALDAEELRILLRRALGEVGRARPGGAGGGVQVLSVTEARGRTFEELFVLGLHRGSFPRPVTEDPLFPDAHRRTALAVLADLPVKERGFDEERYLFAQLLGAAERVTLSWQAVSDDGKERTPSPLVERLRLAGDLEVEEAPEVLGDPAGPARDPAAPPAPRPPLEHAIREGWAGGVGRLREPLAAALAAGPAKAWARAAAGARQAALEELEGVGTRRQRLGPWFGLVGPVREAADLRRNPVYVTRLENLHYCPWQTFLKHVLGLEPVPDALAALPDVTPLLLGDVVHRVLEGVVRDAGAPVGADLAEVSPGATSEVPWPSDAELEARLAGAAREAMRREGIVLPGFARVLAARALPFLERARDLEWGESRRLAGVVGAELSGTLRVADREIHFRVDRADAGTDGSLVLVDYKTGKPVSQRKWADTRRRHLRQQLANGRRLQAAVYARAAGEGRYLFAGPDLPEDVARVAVRRDDAELGESLDAALGALLGAWDQGVLPPRLLDPAHAKEGPACARCEVADACLRGDTGSRRRLAAWLRAEAADAEPRDESERIARRLVEQVGWTS